MSGDASWPGEGPAIHVLRCGPPGTLLVPINLSNSGTRPIVPAARLRPRFANDKGFVTTGLDPATPAEAVLQRRLKNARRRAKARWSMVSCGFANASANLTERLVRMDCRIKSGNDEARKKGGEAPKGACRPLAAPDSNSLLSCGGRGREGVGSASCDRRARLPALRGGACPGERTPGLSPGRASRETRCEGVTSAVDRA
jgi:hypothetical protein